MHNSLWALFVATCLIGPIALFLIAVYKLISNDSSPEWIGVAMVSGTGVLFLYLTRRLPRTTQLLAEVLNGQPLSKKIVINNKFLLVEWTPRAQRELDRRTQPLYVEMELYFSCMVKKYIHFLDQPRNANPVHVGEKLAVYFRPVTSTECSMTLAADLGRQPEIELHNEAVSRMVPKRVFVDFKNTHWIGDYWL